MNTDIQAYNNKLGTNEKEICDSLSAIISNELAEAENKIWHAHPVWFLNGNPIVGYSNQKKGIRLMFWSGKSFEEDNLINSEGKFQDASIFYNNLAEIDKNQITRWLKKSREIQWDYKNIVKRKGQLERIIYNPL